MHTPSLSAFLKVFLGFEPRKLGPSKKPPGLPGGFRPSCMILECSRLETPLASDEENNDDEDEHPSKAAHTERGSA